MMFQNQGITWSGMVKNNTDIQEVYKRSDTVPIGIFKHAPNNTISIMAKNRLERVWDIAPDMIEMYYLDAGTYRSAATIVEHTLGVRHEAPQLIVLYKDNVIYHASMTAIDVTELRAALEKHLPPPPASDEAAPETETPTNETPKVIQTTNLPSFLMPNNDQNAQ